MAFYVLICRKKLLTHSLARRAELIASDVEMRGHMNQRAGIR